MNHNEHIDSIKTLLPLRDVKHEVEIRDNVKPGLDAEEEREVNYHIGLTPDEPIGTPSEIVGTKTGGNMQSEIRKIASAMNAELTDKQVDSVVAYATSLGMVKADVVLAHNRTRLSNVISGLLKEKTAAPKSYSVHVVRIGYASRDIEVQANSPKEAEEKALDEAGGHEFSEHSSDYEVEGISEL